MPAKEILFDESARRALERGADAVANAVKVTLGPAGRNVLLQKKFGSPTITKDGVSVAKEIELSVPLVVRLEGTNAPEGRGILKASGLAIIPAANMADAAKRIVQAVSPA